MTVPGEILEVSVIPEKDDIDAPWDYEKRPEDYNDKRAIRITQPELKPEGKVQLTVGFEAEEEGHGMFNGYFSDREMLDPDAPSRRLLATLPAGLLAVGVLILFGVTAVEEAGSVMKGLLQMAGVLAASAVAGGVLLLIFGGWYT